VATLPGELEPMVADGATDLMHATWRLLDTGWSDGATNMAMDEATMLAVAAGKVPPTLRFYGWSPPCVSIGYAQSLEQEVDLDACRQHGYTWVRRPTGGRAVLHIDELTYSVIAPLDEPRVKGDILTSYRRLSRGLTAGLRLLGCEVVQADPSAVPAPSASAACFDVPSAYEILASGRKLVGSAQARRRRVVLQHGAIPLEGDVARIGEVLVLSRMARETLREELRRKATTLGDVLGRQVSFHECAEALCVGFAQALNLTLQRGELTSDEQAAMGLLREKHQKRAWLFDKKALKVDE
jgi:lipoate-protein ligase A